MDAAFPPELELSQEQDTHKQEINEDRANNEREKEKLKQENLILQLKNALLEQENRLRLPPGKSNPDDSSDKS